MRDLAVIGASWGGLEAVSRVLAGLPSEFRTPVVVVQHRSAQARAGMLEAVLRRKSPLPVKEIDDKQPIEPGAAYVAPADYHVEVEGGHFALDVDEHVRHSRPSIDVAFASAADAYRERLVAVLLTGTGEDGAAGIARVRARGGVTVAQDPETADQAAMPQAAIDTGAVMKVLALDEIPRFLVATCAEEKAA